MAATVGIRELRQRLSAYVRRVKRGEAFVVTERGREVAHLVPAPAFADPIERLVVERGASAPRGDLLEHAHPRPRRPDEGPTPISDALEAVREERLP